MCCGGKPEPLENCQFRNFKESERRCFLALVRVYKYINTLYNMKIHFHVYIFVYPYICTLPLLLHVLLDYLLTSNWTHSRQPQLHHHRRHGQWTCGDTEVVLLKLYLWRKEKRFLMINSKVKIASDWNGDDKNLGWTRVATLSTQHKKKRIQNITLGSGLCSMDYWRPRFTHTMKISNFLVLHTLQLYFQQYSALYLFCVHNCLRS